MTKNDLNLLIEVMRNSKAPYAIRCTEAWNGFEKGLTYEAELATNGQLFAKDKDGIPTAINSVHAFFDPVKALPTPEETAQAERKVTADKLRELASNFLTEERDVFGAGELVEWKPGMCNLNVNSNVFCVIEQVEPFVAKPNGSPFDSAAIEVLDLRVAFIHRDSLSEIFVDSRRMRKAEGL